MDVRDRFEATLEEHKRARYLHPEAMPELRGRYKDLHVQEQWETWQAAYAQCLKDMEPVVAAFADVLEDHEWMVESCPQKERPRELMREEIKKAKDALALYESLGGKE